MDIILYLKAYFISPKIKMKNKNIKYNLYTETNSVISCFYDHNYYLFYQPFPYIRRKLFLCNSENYNLPSKQIYNKIPTNHINILKAYFNHNSLTNLYQSTKINTFIGPKIETNSTNKISFNKLAFKYSILSSYKKIFNS